MPPNPHWLLLQVCGPETPSEDGDGTGTGLLLGTKLEVRGSGAPALAQGQTDSRIWGREGILLHHQAGADRGLLLSSAASTQDVLSKY